MLRRDFRTTARRLAVEALEPRRLLAFDPTPLEQEMFLLVNRFRTDPQGEWDLLISDAATRTSPDPNVTSALRFFQVNMQVLRTQWDALVPVPPLAWNEALYNAAHTHNDYMIAFEQQSHQLPGEPGLLQRFQQAGYNAQFASENIYAYSFSPYHAHAGFVIDWGFTSTGIQQPPGHRDNLMRANVRDIGIAIDEYSNGDFGPLVVTQDLGVSFGGGVPMVVGAVWDDVNDSGWYDAGEGLGGVTIEFTRAGSSPVQVTTMSAGGYQAPLVAGTYTARAFGGGLPAELQTTVVVGAGNVMVNFVVPDGVPPVAEPDLATTIRNQPVTIDVRANDRDPDGNVAAATIQLVSTPPQSNVTVNQAAGTITFTPPAGFTGAAEIWYRLRDAAGFTSDDALVRVAVADPARPYRNPALYVDVDFDGSITPLDSLLIINHLNVVGAHDLDPPTPGDSYYLLYDTSGDGEVTPLDSLLVINHLNGISGDGELEAEAELEPIDELPPLAALYWLFDDEE